MIFGVCCFMVEALFAFLLVRWFDCLFADACVFVVCWFFEFYDLMFCWC